MNIVFNALSRAILVLCCALAVVIIAALSVQIFSRYVLNAPVHMTDDIAEISLIWMTFLGAAAVYRERGHIAVDVISALERPLLKRVVRIALHLMVIAVLGYILTQVWHLRPLMSRLEFGTVPHGPLTSKFALTLVPFGAGGGLTILFALEALVDELLDKEPVR